MTSQSPKRQQDSPLSGRSHSPSKKNTWMNIVNRRHGNIGSQTPANSMLTVEAIKNWTPNRKSRSTEECEGLHQYLLAKGASKMVDACTSNFNATPKPNETMRNWKEVTSESQQNLLTAGKVLAAYTHSILLHFIFGTKSVPLPSCLSHFFCASFLFLFSMKADVSFLCGCFGHCRLYSRHLSLI